MLSNRFFKQILLPGFVFQSVIVAGGYGTGREMVEFFLRLGPTTGLLSMFVAALVWSVVCALTFEFARKLNAYDYRTFFKALLGRGWFLFEVSYIGVILIVLAILAASSGNIMQMIFNVPYNVGVIGLLAYVSIMVFKGSKAIEMTMSFWAIALYVVFIAFFVACFSQYGDNIIHHLQTSSINDGWLINGLRYAGYNLGLIPAVLFTTRHIETRNQAVSAGLLTGLIAILPGVFFYIAMLGHYPNIIEQTVPSTFILQSIGSNSLLIIFHVVLFGTLMETAVGLIHALNERLHVHATEHSLSLDRRLRPLFAFVILGFTTLIAQFGLVNLISKGYGMLTWIIIFVYILPMLTVGFRRITRPM